MATPYSNIYNPFLAKITDHDLPSIEVEYKELTLLNLLNSACAYFSKVCKEDLTDRNDTTLEFADDLSDMSIEILTELMIVEWLKPKLYNTEFFENALGTKDFNLHSPANLLKEIRQTYIFAKQNARNLMINYSYSN